MNKKIIWGYLAPLAPPQNLPNKQQARSLDLYFASTQIMQYSARTAYFDSLGIQKLKIADVSLPDHWLKILERDGRML